MIGDWTEYGAIDMAGELSKTVYDTRDKAAIGGFLSVREHHKKEWERTEFGFFVVLVMDKTKATYQLYPAGARRRYPRKSGNTNGSETPRILPYAPEV